MGKTKSDEEEWTPKRVFELYDKDKSGSLDISELEFALSSTLGLFFGPSAEPRAVPAPEGSDPPVVDHCLRHETHRSLAEEAQQEESKQQDPAMLRRCKQEARAA